MQVRHSIEMMGKLAYYSLKDQRIAEVLYYTFKATCLVGHSNVA